MSRPPLLIAIWVAFHVFKVAQDLLAHGANILTSFPFEVAVWAPTLIMLILTAFGIAGLWTMRKWGLLLLAALGALAVPLRALSGYDWWEHYPLLGPFVSWFWTALFAGTSAIYWKRMSWKFFGRSSDAESVHA